MTFAVTEPSGFASEWLPFQTAIRHVTKVKNLQNVCGLCLNANSCTTKEKAMKGIEVCDIKPG